MGILCSDRGSLKVFHSEKAPIYRGWGSGSRALKEYRLCPIPDDDMCTGGVESTRV